MTATTIGTGQRLRRRCADFIMQAITWVFAGVLWTAIVVAILSLGEIGS